MHIYIYSYILKLGIDCLRKYESSNLEYERFLDNCWICEGWSE